MADISLFDLATGRVRLSRPVRTARSCTSLSPIGEAVLNYLFEYGPRDTVTIQQGAFRAGPGNTKQISQIGLEIMERQGYIKAIRNHREYRGTNTELWALTEKGLAYLGYEGHVVE